MADTNLSLPLNHTTEDTRSLAARAAELSVKLAGADKAAVFRFTGQDPESLRNLRSGGLGAGLGVAGGGLLTNMKAGAVKSAKVYEAAEPVDGMQPKEVYESHKKCAPNEFGMNKEGHIMRRRNKANSDFWSARIGDDKARSVGYGIGALGGSLVGTGAGLYAAKKHVDKKRDKKDDKEKQSAAFEYGEKVAFMWVLPLAAAAAAYGGKKLYNHYHPPAPSGSQLALQGAGYGGLGGAALGGLYGLMAPGTEDVYDDAGNLIGRKKRKALSGGLRGALMGGALGAGLGGVANTLSPGFVDKGVAKFKDFGAPLGISKPKPRSGVMGLLHRIGSIGKRVI